MVISSYTREAGVRSLERQIGEICRKAARRIYEGDEKMIRVTGTNLEDFLGKLKYRPEKKNKKNEVGIVRGLAWTSVGGVTLEIEVNLMPGKGSVVLTGKLGDVMKESAQTGISYIRSISEDYHMDPEFSRNMTSISMFRKVRFQKTDRLPELPWQPQFFLRSPGSRYGQMLP